MYTPINLFAFTNIFQCVTCIEIALSGKVNPEKVKGTTFRAAREDFKQHRYEEADRKMSSFIRKNLGTFQYLHDLAFIYSPTRIVWRKGETDGGVLNANPTAVGEKNDKRKGSAALRAEKGYCSPNLALLSYCTFLTIHFFGFLIQE